MPSVDVDDGVTGDNRYDARLTRLGSAPCFARVGEVTVIENREAAKADAGVGLSLPEGMATSSVGIELRLKMRLSNSRRERPERSRSLSSIGAGGANS